MTSLYRPLPSHGTYPGTARPVEFSGDVSASGAIADGWALTRTISPRATVRVADVDAHGEPVNTYTGTWRVTDGPPAGRPWAVHLAGSDDEFHLLVLDFDAKHPTAASSTAEQALACRAHLAEVGIDSVLVASGPSGGRHVWIGLARPVSADLARALAVAARQHWPSLDIAPLANPRTGSVRPPGSPHRDGGHAHVLDGELDQLRMPATTPEAIHDVVTRLRLDHPPTAEHGPGGSSSAATHTRGTVEAPTTGGMSIDTTGHPWLPGARRPLPTPVVDLLNAPIEATTDTSARLWRILTAAATAHWRLSDVAALLPRPGLVHVRTTRRAGRRHPRPARETRTVLHRQWRRAVTHAATRTTTRVTPRELTARARETTTAVQALQTRADAAPGRWSRRGGPADRRVLDALCELALEACRAAIEADIRRLALLTGIGRETARTALHRLAADGWIHLNRDAHGTTAHRWALGTYRRGPRAALSTELQPCNRSQGIPRPGAPDCSCSPSGPVWVSGRSICDACVSTVGVAEQASSSDRTGWGEGPGGDVSGTDQDEAVWLQRSHCLGLLTRVRELRGHDAWTGHQIHQGNYIADSLASHTQPGSEQERRAVRAWDQLAREQGRTGTLQRRAAAVAVERSAWAWWQAELAWMKQRQRRHRPHDDQLSLLTGQRPTWPAHPRRHGRCDYRTALAIMRAENDSPHATSSTPGHTAQAA